MSPESSVALQTPPGRRGQRGIRATILTSAVGATALALVVGAIGFAVLLGHLLQTDLEDVAVARADQVATAAAEADVPHTAAAVRASRGRGMITQLIDAQGSVLASSDPAAEAIPVTVQLVAPGELRVQEVSGLPWLEEEPHLVVIRGIRTKDEVPAEVAVSASTHALDALVRIAVALFAAISLMLLALTYLLVRRAVNVALRQVERIRVTVSEIPEAGLGERVEVPPSGDEIARLASTMNVMLDRLQRADEAKRSFVSNASHELRSPLTTLRLNLEMPEDPVTSDRQLTRQVMFGEIVRLQRLVDDLLILTKADDRGLRLEPREVDLDEVLDAEVRRIRATSALQVRTEIDVVRVFGDEGYLEQAVRNLVDNAIRHAENGIALELHIQDGQAIIQIDNDGPTPTGADRRRIFERFVRLDDARARDSGGSGLGLSIVAEIVAAHHGSISVEESPQGWCRFRIQLPAAESDQEPDPPAETA